MSSNSKNIIKFCIPEQDSRLCLLRPEHAEFLASGELRKNSGKDVKFDYLALVQQGADLTSPLPTKFEWSCPIAVSEFVLIWQNGEEIWRKSCGTAHSTTISTLMTGCKYDWHLEGRLPDGSVTISETRTFQTASTPPRWCFVPDICNIRDIGGWQTKEGKFIRQGLFYRGGELNVHMVLSPEGKKVLTEELKIRTVIDIRSPGEFKDAPDHPLQDTCHVLNFPLPGAYAKSLNEPERFECTRKIFRCLTQKENYPVYLHCWGGADRTGVIAMMLLAILSMEDETLFTEYELTSFGIWGIRSRNSPLFQEFYQAVMEKYGQSDDCFATALQNYLKECGIQERELQDIRAIFTITSSDT